MSWAIRVSPKNHLLVTAFYDDVTAEELPVYLRAVQELAADFPKGFKEIVDGRRVAENPSLSGPGIFSAVEHEDEHSGSRRIAIVVDRPLIHGQARQYDSARTARFDAEARFFENGEEAAAWQGVADLGREIERFLAAAPEGADRAG
ncbi:MAG: hypothetical protein V3T86_15940 [Planctomycetota bacterium]